MKRKILTGLQLLLLAVTLTVFGASMVPSDAQAGECQIKCLGGPYQCGANPDCSWSCT